MSSLQQYKCPSCGGAVVFDSQEQQMRCNMCGNIYSPTAFEGNADLEKSEAPDEMSWQYREDTWQEGEKEELRTYSCPSCGGEVMGDKNMGATACPYCDNPVIIPEQFSGDLRPDLVIPFQINKDDAKAALKRHIKGHRFVPKIFRNEHHIDEMKGIYVPFWLFDADVDAAVRYEGIKRRSWIEGKYNVTETSNYALMREGSMSFQKIPIDGSKKMADDMMESIEPFDSNYALPFDTAYLSGYLADRYDVSADESQNRANERIKKSTEDSFIQSLQGYDSIRPVSSSINITKGDINYALLPVWILNTKWKDKLYTFAINGQSGKIVGDLPMDKAAYWRTFILIMIALTALLFWLFFLLVR